MSKRLKILSVGGFVAAMMAASVQAATAFDLTARSTGFHEPATMIALGTLLLATFRGQRQA